MLKLNIVNIVYHICLKILALNFLKSPLIFYEEGFSHQICTNRDNLSVLLTFTFIIYLRD